MLTPEQLREQSARLRQEARESQNPLVKRALAALALAVAERAEKYARERELAKPS